MKISQAAVFESKRIDRARIVQGLRKAGLKVTSAQEPSELAKERLVVLGPSVKSGSTVARRVRTAVPEALVLAAMKRPKNGVSWADGVLPLPVSAQDLKVRLPELAQLKALTAAARLKPRAAAAEPEAPAPRPGEGILDPLTGFYTFAHFKEVLFVEVKRARRYNFPLSCALISFDPLDETLTEDLRAKLAAGLALSIRRSLRDTDYPVQYNPERVLLLMPHTDLQGALVVSRRICERVARATLQHGDKTLSPTISVGVAAANQPSKEFSFGEMVKHAQDAQERARAAGGNRVEFSVPDPAEFPTETYAVIPGEASGE